MDLPTTGIEHPNLSVIEIHTCNAFKRAVDGHVTPDLLNVKEHIVCLVHHPHLSNATRACKGVDEPSGKIPTDIDAFLLQSEWISHEGKIVVLTHQVGPSLNHRFP